VQDFLHDIARVVHQEYPGTAVVMSVDGVAIEAHDDIIGRGGEIEPLVTLSAHGVSVRVVHFVTSL
jgi:hypothetical protein